MDNVSIEKIMEQIISETTDHIDKDFEKALMNRLSQVDGLLDYLEEYMARDLKLFFISNIATQPYIKGRYNFINSLYKKIRKSKELSLDKN